MEVNQSFLNFRGLTKRRSQSPSTEMLLVMENTDEREELSGLCAISPGQLRVVFKGIGEQPILFPFSSDTDKSVLSHNRDRSKLILYVSKGSDGSTGIRTTSKPSYQNP